MSLLTPGYFQSTFFPKSYWVTDYWVEYETGVIIPVPEPEPEPEVEERRGGNLAIHEPVEMRDKRRLLAQAKKEDEILLIVIKLFLREVNR